MLDWMPEAVLVCDAAGEIAYANRQAETLTGYGRQELIGRKIELLVPVGLRSVHVGHRRRYAVHPELRTMALPASDFKLRRKDGSIAEVDIALAPVGGDVVAVVRDVTDRHQMEDALEHRALHDPLTDLANRSLFFDRLSQGLHAAKREGGQLALIMLDLDGFKDINDEFGHSVGDDVLKEMGRRLSAGLRATDTAARIGGDEFAWILPRVSSRRSVQRTVHKRLAAAREPMTVQGREVQVGITGGIAIYPDDGRDIETLLRRADLAMYSAKRHGLAIAFHLPRRRTA